MPTRQSRFRGTVGRKARLESEGVSGKSWAEVTYSRSFAVEGSKEGTEGGGQLEVKKIFVVLIIFRCFVSSCGNYWSIFDSHGQSRSRAVGDTGDVAERGWQGWTGERGGGLASDGVQACVCHCARRESGSMALVPVFSYRRVYGWRREAEGATVGCLHRYRPRFPGSACSASMLPASNLSFSWFLKTDSAQLKPQLDRTSRGWPSPPVGV